MFSNHLLFEVRFHGWHCIVYAFKAIVWVHTLRWVHTLSMNRRSLEMAANI